MKQKMKMKTIAAAVALAIGPAHADIHQVTSRHEGAEGSLRSVVAAAKSGDSIMFAPWLHGKRIELDSPITIDKVLTINGDIDSDNRPDITLDGQKKHRIFIVRPAGNLELMALQFENGKSSDGGVINNRGSVKVFQSVFSGNEGGNGGAISNYKTLIVEKSTFDGNTASRDGGAIHSAPISRGATAPTMRVSKSTFSKNWAHAKGGAIYNQGELTAQTSTFSSNWAMHSEGAALMGNQGGAIFTVTSNDRGGHTTGIYDSTFFGNKANPVTNGGGAVYNLKLDHDSSVVMKRTVIAKSSGENCAGTGGFTLETSWSDDNSCSTESRGDPNLGYLEDNGGYTLTHMPKSGSGLIDASGTSCPAEDQRGALRKSARTPLEIWAGQGSQCDIGAVERDGSDKPFPAARSVDKRVPAQHAETIIRTHALTTLRSAKSALEVDKATLTDEKATLEEAKAALETRQAELIAEIDELDTISNRLESQVSTLQGEKNNLNQAYSRLYTEKAAIEVEKATLWTQVQLLQSQSEQFESRIGTLRGEKLALASQNDMFKRLEAKHSADVVRLTSEKSELADKKDEYERRIAELRSQLATVTAQSDASRDLETELKTTEARLDHVNLRVAELESQFVGSLDIRIGDAGNVNALTIDDSSNMINEYRVIYKAGATGSVLPLADTTTQHTWEHSDGSKISSGSFQGPNGIINWRSVSVMVPGTDFHVTKYSLNSTSPFGNVKLGVYADIDIGSQANQNTLIVGGTGHSRRLMVADGTDPNVGVAIGVRSMKNAWYNGYLAIDPRVSGANGNVLDADQMVGISDHLQSFTPDQVTYPGTTGVGPNDIAITQSVKLKHSAKLATFEITQVAAPDGVIY